jgi:type IV secretory pathway VirB9-like protein
MTTRRAFLLITPASLICVLQISFISTPGLAEPRSTVSAARDNHIQIATYSPTKRTEVIGLLGQPTTFTFPSGESIYRVTQTKRPGADGNPVEAAWETNDLKDVKDSPLGNNLTLWPMATGTTIMIFKGGAPATAVAEPVQTAALDSADAPVQKPKSRRTRERAVREQNEAELAADRLRVDSFNRAAGYHYHGQGDAHSGIIPLCPLDNGIWTIMRFPGLSLKPAIYVGVCDGHNERLARQHGTGDFVVVEEIAASFCLRLSPYAINVINDAYSPAGNPTGTDTIAPTVDRKILQARSPSK